MVETDLVEGRNLGLAGHSSLAEAVHMDQDLESLNLVRIDVVAVDHSHGQIVVVGSIRRRVVEGSLVVGRGIAGGFVADHEMAVPAAMSSEYVKISIICHCVDIITFAIYCLGSEGRQRKYPHEFCALGTGL